MITATKPFVTFSTLVVLVVGVIGTTFAGEGVSPGVRSEPPFLMAQRDIEDGPAPYFFADRGDATLGVCLPFLSPAGTVAILPPSRPSCGVALEPPEFSE